MAAPTFTQNKQGSKSGAGPHTLAYDVATQSGALLTLAIEAEAGKVINTPSGWTRSPIDDTPVQNGSASAMWVFHRESDGLTSFSLSVGSSFPLTYILAEHSGPENPILFGSANIRRVYPAPGYCIMPATPYPAGPVAILGWSFQPGPEPSDTMTAGGTGVVLRTPNAWTNPDKELALSDILRDGSAGTTPLYPAAGGWRHLFTHKGRQMGVTLAFVSAGEAVVAEFSATPTSGPAPTSIAFSELCSGEPDEFLWDFGDGGSSTDANPTHEYDEPGTKTVVLTATRTLDDDSDAETKVAYITILEPRGWDSYDPADPNGDPVEQFSTITRRKIRYALNDPGSGSFEINRALSAEATAVALQDGAIVKTRFPWRSQYDFAWIIEKRDPVVAAVTEQGGEVIACGGRGIRAYLSRARLWSEAFTTGVDESDTWALVWETGVVSKPSGVTFIEADPDSVYVIDRATRRVYRVNQATRAKVAVSAALFSGPAAGLSDDPDDPTVAWALEAPWLDGGSGHTKIHKLDISDLDAWVVDDTFDLGSAIKHTDIRANDDYLWLSRYDSTNSVYARSKVDGSVIGGYPKSVSYAGVVQDQMNAISSNGTELALWYEGTRRALIVDAADVTAVLRVISTTGIASFGGEWTTEGGEDFFYMVSREVSRTWKYQLTIATPVDPVDGIWRLNEPTPGGILWRLIAEAQADGRPQQPFPDLTHVFTATLDSNGDPWDTHDGTLEFDARVGDDYLPTADRLIPYGVIQTMSPEIVLGGYNAATYGTDRSSASFAAGKVRFEKGVNIVPELRGRSRERDVHSHMLAGGRDSLYATATDDDLGYVREGFIGTDLEDATALTGTAEAELANERVVAQRLVVRVPIGSDEATGRYLPWTHYDVGDLCTLHTGDGETDYNELTVRIYAFTLEEDDAGDWPTALLELGSAFLDQDTPSAPTSAPATTGVGGGATILAGNVTVEGTDDEGSVLTSAIGRTIRSAGFSVYQISAGVIGVVLKAASRLLGLDDVDADDIAADQVLAYDAAAARFVPASLGGIDGVIEDLAATETDTEKVLRPDGTGGVAFGDEAAGGGGGALMIPYAFSSTTTDSDPGAGTMRLSNATQYLAVTLRADLLDANGDDVTTILDAIGALISTIKAYVRVAAADDPTRWLVGTVAAVASPSGYRNLTIANIAKSDNSPLVDGESVVVSFDIGTAATLHAALSSIGVNDHHNRDHASTHGPAAADALKLDDLAGPDDNTDLNASTTAHGLLRKLSGNVADVLLGDGTFGTPSAAASASANASGDVTTTSSLADVTGATLSLGAGTWIVAGIFDVVLNSNPDRTFEAHLDSGGVDQAEVAPLIPVGLDSSDRASIMRVWRLTLGATTTVKLRAKHSGGSAGDYTVKQTNSGIVAWQAGLSVNPLNKFDATTAPTANEDSGDGYSVGSVWIDVTNDRSYTCLDATVAAAVWGLTAQGAWVTYTPTLTGTTTNPTVGNGTLTGRWRYMGRQTVQVAVYFTFGSTSNAGSGAWEFTLPSGLTALTGIGQAGTLALIDSGTRYFSGSTFLASGASKFNMPTADGASSQVAHNNPMTWATNDVLAAALTIATNQ